MSALMGSVAALLSAAAWAVGDILWSRIGEKISPFSMNMGKGIIGSLYFIVVLLLVGIRPIPPRDFFYLGLSGVLGIAVGDTLFFASLKHLGPRLASLTGSLIPVCIGISAFLFLGERPSALAVTGICLTVAGVTWVLIERTPVKGPVKNKSLGIKYGLLAVACTTAGVIFAKLGVKSGSTIQAAFIRLFFGVFGVVAWGVLTRQFTAWTRPLKDPRLLKEMALAVFVVVFGGFWMSLVALKYMYASVAGTLLATTPLFMLPLVAIMQKEKISPVAGFGAFVAVVGVALIMIS